MIGTKMTDENFEDDEEFVISKSSIKRDLQALCDLGKELVDQPPVVLKKLPISEDLLSNLLQAQKFSKKP